MSRATVFTVLRLGGFFTSFFAIAGACYTVSVGVGMSRYLKGASDRLASVAGGALKGAGLDSTLSVTPILSWTVFAYAVVAVLGALLFVWARRLARFFVDDGEPAGGDDGEERAGALHG